jgi:hypothetical protein
VVTLRIEHAVRDFEMWKRTFDGDPVGRREAGVVAYRVLRPADDPAYASVDLDFETAAEADAFADRLRALWETAGPDLGLERSSLRVYVVFETETY